MTACAGGSASATTTPAAADDPDRPSAADGRAARPTTSSALASIAAAPTDADRIVCWFGWRSRGGHDFLARNSRVVTLADSSERKRFELGDHALDVAYEDGPSGGKALTIDLAAGSLALSEVYDFAGADRPANLPTAGHGFTGLRYVTHPRSRSEVQYMCETLRPSETFSDDGSQPITHGPSAPPTATVACDVAGADATGKTTTSSSLVVAGHDITAKPEDVDLADRHAGGSKMFGSVSWSTFRMTARHDAGGLYFDTAVGKGGVRDMYQDHGTLPTNLTGDGFTGKRSITDTTTGAQVTYVCRTRTS